VRTSNQLSLAAVALASAAMGLVSCDQPRVECTTGQSGAVPATTNFLAFATTYKRVEVIAGSNCQDAPSELVGFATYHAASGTSKGVTRDFSSTTVALRSGTMGAIAWAAEDAGVEGGKATLSALGGFTAREPDDKDFCYVPELTPAQVDYPEVSDPMGKVIFPRTTLSYKWSHVRVYVTAAAPGTQFSADVVITTSDQCSVQYSAIGMWPAIDCGVKDAQGNVTPDDTLCDPEPDLAKDRPAGSGLNPDFGPTYCDPVLARCVLKADEIPALGGYQGGK
jgi:hypothetical protein